ncbi:MAG: type II toxin-antitoxin system VapC family toxin [Hormoscilla sp. GUM202]|nr:type II toxin-antitoxin system VapC family toxin [Hormoscilla sp. GUM202]
MKYLLDTDTCIYWLNGRDSVRNRLLAVGWAEVGICVIIVAELYFGAYNSNRVASNIERAEQFMRQLSVFPLDNNTLRRFGELKSQLRRIGRPIANLDLLIASVAVTNNMILVTNNTRHYERIGELKLENWIES